MKNLGEKSKAFMAMFGIKYPSRVGKVNDIPTVAKLMEDWFRNIMTVLRRRSQSFLDRLIHNFNA